MDPDKLLQPSVQRGVCLRPMWKLRKYNLIVSVRLLSGSFAIPPTATVEEAGQLVAKHSGHPGHFASFWAETGDRVDGSVTVEAFSSQRSSSRRMGPPKMLGTRVASEAALT